MEKRPGETAGRSVPPRLGTARGQEEARAASPSRPTVPPPLWAPDTGFLSPGLGGEGCSHHPRWTGSERPRSPRSVFARAGPGGGCGLRPARADSLAGRCAPGVGFTWGVVLKWPLFLGWPRLRRYPPALAQ